EAFQYSNGPYLEIEHRALARKHGYNEERIARLWRNAAEQACEQLAAMQSRLSVFGRFDALRPKIEEAKRTLAQAKVVGFRRFAKKQAANGGPSFSVPAPQPPADEESKDTRAKASEVIRRNFRRVASALPIASARTKPEEEPEQADEPLGWTAVNLSGAQL